MIGRWLARHQPVWLEYFRLGGPLCVGPTGEIGLFFAGRWDERSVFVQLITKLDEAGTHGDSNYMTMGGYIARLNEWNRFDHKWKKALRKARLDYFHVKEHGDHPFALKGPGIADACLMAGFVVRLDKADFDKYYRAGGWGGKAQPDSMYGLCFRFCVSYVLSVAKAELPHEELTLNFVVEENRQYDGAPAAILQELKRKRIVGVSEFLGYAVPGEKRKIPGLQAADGLASGAWHLEKQGIPLLGQPMDPARSLANWDAKQTGFQSADFSLPHRRGCAFPI